MQCEVTFFLLQELTDSESNNSSDEEEEVCIYVDVCVCSVCLSFMLQSSGERQ